LRALAGSVAAHAYLVYVLGLFFHGHLGVSAFAAPEAVGLTNCISTSHLLHVWQYVRLAELQSGRTHDVGQPCLFLTSLQLLDLLLQLVELSLVEVSRPPK
jgi:hypothetical protein